MTRLPNNPPPSLYCHFCHGGMLLGNGTACYTCMSISGREHLGKQDNGDADAVRFTKRAEWLSMIHGLTRRMNDAKAALQALRGDQPTWRLPEGKLRKQLEECDQVLGTNVVERGPHALYRAVPPDQPPPPYRELGFAESPAEAPAPIPPLHTETHRFSSEGGLERAPAAPRPLDSGTVLLQRTSVNIPIVHEDAEEMPSESDVLRAGNESVCGVCGLTYAEHQLHQFGTGSMPLFLRRICDLPDDKPRWRKL